jgi:aldehyde dehydrogenase (NAD+)
VIVHEAVADRFLAALAERTAAARVGDALGEGVEVGPLVNAGARDRVNAALERASTSARAIVAPGPYREGALAEGFFVPPSVFEVPDSDPGELWREELFGPVVAVRRVESAAEGFRLVNDSEYGLSAAIFTTDLGRALAAIDDVRVGVVHVNSASAGADLHVPFGGNRGSALGPKEQGQVARDFFTETATVYLRG